MSRTRRHRTCAAVRERGAGTHRGPLWGAVLVVAAVGLCAAAAARPGPPGETARTVQRLERSSGPAERIESRNFEITYNPSLLPASRASEAAALAERAYSRCMELFGTRPSRRIRLDLTPRFRGATGFASPEDPQVPSPRGQARVGVRYHELEYLGLTGEYVLRHEVAHVFSGPLASTSLGEGIADWAAGGYSGLEMRPGWGVVLREAGLWIEPEAFFITGEFPSRPEVDEVIRTAQYVQSGLLVQYLVRRFGWQRVREFAAAYGAARGRLISNEERTRLPPPRPAERGTPADPRRPPDPVAVRAAFERLLGEPWDRLAAGWEREMAADVVPAAEAGRLVLGQRIYASIRAYEMWAMRLQPSLSPETQRTVEDAYTRANRDLHAGRLEEAAGAFARAAAMVERLRRPVSVASREGAGKIAVTSPARGASNYR